MADAKESAGSGFELSQVLAAVGAGIGVLGFVTFAGGAVLWGRMDAAGLPADELVGFVPRETLLVTGASVLVPAVAIALGTVLILLAVDQGTALWTRRGERRNDERLEELRRNARAADQEARKARQAADELSQALEGLSGPLQRLKSQGVEVTSADDLATKARNEVRNSVEAAAQAAAERALLADEEASRHREVVDRERWRITKWLGYQTRGRRILVLAVLLGAQGVLATWSLKELGTFPTLLLVGLAIATSFACSVVLLNTESFAWFGLAAFVATGLFAGASSYAGVRSADEFIPVAVIRTGEIPSYGLFIAQSKERFLLTDPTGSRGLRVLSIPTADALEVAVLPLSPRLEAGTQAYKAARELCTRRAQRPPVARGKKPAPVCSVKMLGRPPQVKSSRKQS